MPGDYPPIADILNLIEPGSTSAEAMAAEDQRIPIKGKLHREESGLLAGFGRERVVAEDASGRVIGFASVWRAPWAAPGDLASLFCAHPDFRRQGVGSSLVQHLEGWARAQGASVLQSMLKDWIPDSLPFAEKRGFVKDAHVFELTLELARFDGTQFAGRESAGGVRYLTLADAPGEESERKLYELYRESLKDNPGHRGWLPNFGHWREEALGDRTRPDWVFIAEEAGRFVGVSTLFTTDDPGVIYTDYTGVARSHRGRGIAMALKLRTIAAATAAGAHTMSTETEAKNGPMQAVNRKLGYMPGQGAYRIIKQL